MAILNWISDQDLNLAVTTLLNKAEEAKVRASVKFGSNVIDPFSAIFEMSGFNTGFADWLKNEEARQAQKTLQNFVGDFHQTILGSCNGWQNMRTGKIIDLLNSGSSIIAEVKNKYNTVSGSKLVGHYKSLESAVMDKTSVYKGFTAYFVEIIPKKPVRYDQPFVPSDSSRGQKSTPNPLIRQIDGLSFYELATGDPNALSDLYSVLPGIVTSIKPAIPLDSNKLQALFKLAYG